MVAVPEAEEVLGSVRNFRAAQQLAQHLFTELDRVRSWTSEIMSNDEQARAALSSSTSHSTERLLQLITESTNRATADCAISLRQAVNSLATLSDQYVELTYRSERLIQDCRSTLTKIRCSIEELRSISSESGETQPHYWRQEVPLELPSSCTIEPDQTMHGIVGAGAVKRAAQNENWYWLAITHNSLLNEIAEYEREWELVEQQSREYESGTATVLEQAVEDLLHSQRRLSNTTGLDAATFTTQHPMDAWNTFGFTGQAAHEWAEAHSFEIAGNYALPPEIQQAAAERSLELAIAHPEHAYIAMGFQGTGLTMQRFINQTRHLRQSIKQSQQQYPGQPHQLISFGRHNDALTAVVSVGDFSNAERVTVVVPGMFSHVGNINTLIAGAGIIQTASGTTSKTATVAFMGYDSPGLLQETGSTQARLGAHELSRFLGAVAADPAPAWIGTASHSYGSFTTGEAVKVIDQPIQSFTSIGSAGLADNTQREDLNVEHIAAISADPPPISVGPMPKSTALAALAAYFTHDAVAPIGRLLGSHGVDPRSLPGVTTIPNTGTDVPVTSHAIWTPNGASHHGYLSEDTPSVEALAKLHAGVQSSGSTGQTRQIEVP